MIICKFEDGGEASLRHMVVDSIVLKDNKIMMVKRAPNMLEGGKWGLVGGYVDRDETLKQAAEREVLEETGWTVKDTVLLGIIDNPNRPKEDRQNIAMIYISQAVEKIGEADHESTEQKWYALDELPDENSIAFDHADTIRLYKKYLDQKFPLPYIS